MTVSFNDLVMQGYWVAGVERKDDKGLTMWPVDGDYASEKEALAAAAASCDEDGKMPWACFRAPPALLQALGQMHDTMVTIPAASIRWNGDA